MQKNRPAKRIDVFSVEYSGDTLTREDFFNLEVFLCQYIDTINISDYNQFTIEVLKETELTKGSDEISLSTNSSSDFVHICGYSWYDGKFFDKTNATGVSISFSFDCKNGRLHAPER